MTKIFMYILIGIIINITTSVARVILSENVSNSSSPSFLQPEFTVRDGKTKLGLTELRLNPYDPLSRVASKVWDHFFSEDHGKFKAKTTTTRRPTTTAATRRPPNTWRTTTETIMKPGSSSTMKPGSTEQNEASTKPPQSMENPGQSMQQPEPNPQQPQQPGPGQQQPGPNPQQPGPNPQQPGPNPQQPGPGQGPNPQQPGPGQGPNPQQPGQGQGPNPQQPGLGQQQPGPNPQQPGPGQQQPGPGQQQPGPNPQQPGQSQQQPGPNPQQPGQSQQQPGPNPQQPGQGQQQPGPNPQQPGPGQGPNPQQPGPQYPGPNPQQPGPQFPGPNPQQPFPPNIPPNGFPNPPQGAFLQYSGSWKHTVPSRESLSHLSSIPLSPVTSRVLSEPAYDTLLSSYPSNTLSIFPSLEMNNSNADGMSYIMLLANPLQSNQFSNYADTDTNSGNSYNSLDQSSIALLVPEDVILIEEGYNVTTTFQQVHESILNVGKNATIVFQSDPPITAIMTKEGILFQIGELSQNSFLLYISPNLMLFGTKAMKSIRINRTKKEVFEPFIIDIDASGQVEIERVNFTNNVTGSLSTRSLHAILADDFQSENNEVESSSEEEGEVVSGDEFPLEATQNGDEENDTDDAEVIEGPKFKPGAGFKSLLQSISQEVVGKLEELSQSSNAIDDNSVQQQNHQILQQSNITFINVSSNGKFGNGISKVL